MNNYKTNLLSLLPEDLESLMSTLAQPRYRAMQIFERLHSGNGATLEEITNIPASLKEKLRESGYDVFPVKIAERFESKLDGTRKYLFELYDGNVIESVLMQYKHGYSICISSQVGCRMGCTFCASTIDGRVRDLDAGEMLSQIYQIQKNEGIRIHSLVVMGSGEPMDNFDNLVKFVKLISHPKGMNLSGRNITVSTCGLTEKMRELADMKFALTLAVSLHSPTDELRRTFMPVAKRYTIDEIMKAADYYFEQTGRRVTFEYSLIKGLNDTPECAQELSRLLAGRNAHVNLIPVNPIKERKWERSSDNNVSAFKLMLEKNRINATIRRGMGADIDAACGQLRRRYLGSHGPEEHETR
ncbi:MAG: 23S rRNA (adenine(2503)-C(2))-methyltransferase RlmN [Lachnospiraceae bacterium]|nr:23S rRNA (adenine(2503)-C(2))-methyltransferase RlmN [Lachnospiraceae bacterium]